MTLQREPETSASPLKEWRGQQRQILMRRVREPDVTKKLAFPSPPFFPPQNRDLVENCLKDNQNRSSPSHGNLRHPPPQSPVSSFLCSAKANSGSSQHTNFLVIESQTSSLASDRPTTDHWGACTAFFCNVSLNTNAPTFAP
jgi:hypothetical protein